MASEAEEYIVLRITSADANLLQGVLVDRFQGYKYAGDDPGIQDLMIEEQQFCDRMLQLLYAARKA